MQVSSQSREYTVCIRKFIYLQWQMPSQIREIIVICKLLVQLLTYMLIPVHSTVLQQYQCMCLYICNAILLRKLGMARIIASMIIIENNRSKSSSTQEHSALHYTPPFIITYYTTVIWLWPGKIQVIITKVDMI